MFKKNLPRPGYLLTALLSLIIIGALSELAYSHKAAPQASKTGAPGEQKCNQCHSGTVNSGGGTASIDFGGGQTEYTPGNTYTMQVTLTDPNASRYGFQMTALAGGGGSTVGSFAITNATITAMQSGLVQGNSRSYISHKNAGANNTWSFDWTAPATDIGPIMFYLAANGANGNNSTSGDKVYTTTLSVTAAPPPAPTAAFTANSNAVCEGNSITFTDQSGNTPTAWNWSFPGGSPATSTQQNPTISYSTPGTYDVTLIATNGNGSDTLLQTNMITINNNPAVSMSTNTDPLCDGGTDGILTAAGSGGDGSYSYDWSNGATGATQSNLSAGTYTVTVTDGNGCTGTVSASLSNPTAITYTSSSTDASCGAADGTASVSATGGTGSLSYSWSSGGTAATDTALSAGVYTVTITDQNGCTEVTSVSVSNFGAPTVSGSVTDPDCYGDLTGTVTSNVSGGSAPFSYLWSTGDTSTTIAGLPAGSYSLTVTDSTGCIATHVYVINQPDSLALTGSTTSSTIGFNDGSATVTPAGGTQPYSYNWSNGSGSQTITGLAGGNYTVTVTDSNGCSETLTLVVDEVVGIAPLFDGNAFTMYPNPSTGIFHIRFERNIQEWAFVSVYDLNGRMIHKTDLFALKNYQTLIDLGQVAEGNYLVRVRIGNETVTRRLWVKH